MIMETFARLISPKLGNEADRYFYLRMQVHECHQWLSEFLDIRETLQRLLELDVDHWRALGVPAKGKMPAEIMHFREMLRDSAIAKASNWRCFHCDETFTDRHSAKMHFGMDQCSDPACKVKMGAEGSLVTALRRVEAELADAMFAIHNESTEAAKAYHAQQSRHGDQLRAAEELGYERGLRDGRADPTPEPQTVGPADQIISQIEELFPNWRAYRDLIDCITCELHELRKRAEGRP